MKTATDPQSTRLARLETLRAAQLNTITGLEAEIRDASGHLQEVVDDLAEQLQEQQLAADEEVLKRRDLELNIFDLDVQIHKLQAKRAQAQAMIATIDNERMPELHKTINKLGQDTRAAQDAVISCCRRQRKELGIAQNRLQVLERKMGTLRAYMGPAATEPPAEVDATPAER